MTNSYYNHGSYPSPNAPGSSAALRAELGAISDGFDKLPALGGNANYVVTVNGAANALAATNALSGIALTGGSLNNTPIGGTTPSTGAFTTVSASGGFTGNLTGNVTGNLTGNVTGNLTGNVTGNVTGDVSGNAGTVTNGVYLTATQTLTNKTINLSSNTLVATSAQLAAALTDETGSGAAVFADSPALTGVPTAPTATTGTNTTQIATTAFVQQTAFASTLPDQTGNNGKYLTTNGTAASWVTPTFGDVTGPASSTDNNIVLFNGATGKLVKDSGVTLASKQDALVSGTNIKTVNSNSLLGSGNVSVGTVTSVGMSVPAFLSVTGTPVTGTGTLAVTLSGTALPEANGGTGQTSYTIGDILYASAATTLTKLAGVAVGNALISGGVGAAPSWGKVSLSGTQHVTGTLPVGNGGTGAITLTGVVIGNGTSAFTVKTNPTGAFVGDTDTQTLTNKTLGTGTTLNATVTGSDNLLTRVMLQDAGWDWHDSGTTNALNFVNGSHQRWAPNTGAQTLSITNWPPSGNLGELLIEGVNLGAATITWPTVNWINPDGTTTTTASTYFSNAGRTLKTSGTDFIFLWTRDAGTTIYGKVV